MPMIPVTAAGAQACRHRGPEMSIARSIVTHVEEIRLRQAREQAHHARLEFLRADWFGGDVDTPAHRVALATARADQIEAEIRRERRPN